MLCRLPAVPTYLDEILAFHRRRAALDQRTPAELEAAVAAASPLRAFSTALLEAHGPDRMAVIAEVKRRSPSAGDLAPELDPRALGRAYAVGGAACLSVLTDGPHFGGSPEDLVAARDAAGVPVLRKDFTVAEADLYDARSMGADAVLLIVAALTDAELARFLAVGSELGLGCLVEVHDEEELGRALAVGSRLIGVNQRDLRSFTVDRDRALRVGDAIPDGVVRVAESGIRGPEDVARLRDGGFHAVLVGEAFVTAPDPARAVRDFSLTAVSPAR